MCGLFGFVRYGDKIKNLADLTNSLAEQSAVRGTDATGIAFYNAAGIDITKDNKSAYRINFKHSDEIVALIGHTRHTTQGNAKKTYNNHPFPGKCINSRFALAHNGVLTNDKELRIAHKLPRSKIETDSYVAVQLLEKQRRLNFDSIKFMAEQTEGSFSYSILDDKNNIWLVKGDSPLSILHAPTLKLYIFASTDEILWKALVDYPPLFSVAKNGIIEPVDVSEGEILKINPDGSLERSNFTYSYSYGKKWYQYGSYSYINSSKDGSGYTRNEYIDDLKYIASYLGYGPSSVDNLLAHGFTLEEIEDYLYCGGEV